MPFTPFTSSSSCIKLKRFKLHSKRICSQIPETPQGAIHSTKTAVCDTHPYSLEEGGVYLATQLEPVEKPSNKQGLMELRASKHTA